MTLGGFVAFQLFLLLWILMRRNPFQFPIVVLRTISLGRWGLDQSLLLSSLILLLVGLRRSRRSGLLMASIPLLGVFLLLTIGVLLGGLGVGLLERLTLSGRRGIGGVLAGSVRTGVTSGFLWGFLGVGILGILWGSTTLLLVGDAESVTSKFLSVYSCWILYKYFLLGLLMSLSLVLSLTSSGNWFFFISFILVLVLKYLLM